MGIERIDYNRPVSPPPVVSEKMQAAMSLLGPAELLAMGQEAHQEAMRIVWDVEHNILGRQITKPEVFTATQSTQTSNPQDKRAQENFVRIRQLVSESIVTEIQNGVAGDLIQTVFGQEPEQIYFYLTESDLSYQTARTVNGKSTFFGPKEVSEPILAGQKECYLGQIDETPFAAIIREKTHFSTVMKCLKKGHGSTDKIDDRVTVTFLTETEPEEMMGRVKEHICRKGEAANWQLTEHVDNQPNPTKSPKYESNQFNLRVVRPDGHQTTIEVQVKTPQQCLEDYYTSPSGEPDGPCHIDYKARGFTRAIRELYPTELWPDLAIEERVKTWARNIEHQRRVEELHAISLLRGEINPDWRENEPLATRSTEDPSTEVGADESPATR